MALEYVNRKGDTYYLQQGRTKTGKPKYYFGRRLKAVPLEAMPEGYEAYESPETGQVYARKALPTEITGAERRMVEEAVVRLAGLKHVIVDVEPEALVVYLPATDDEPVERLAEIFEAPWSRIERFKEKMARRAPYQKIMRFQLTDAGERLYAPQRWCFRGAIDDWMPLFGGPAPLPDLLDKYAPHLGKESFFELI